MTRFDSIRLISKLLFLQSVKFPLEKCSKFAFQSDFFCLGKTVLIVNGAHRGEKARLEEIHTDKYSVDVTIISVSEMVKF